MVNSEMKALIVLILHGLLVSLSMSGYVVSNFEQRRQLFNSRELAIPGVSFWGMWRNWNYCPPDMFAVGMQLKVKPKFERSYDSDYDSAPTSLIFYCQYLHDCEFLFAF